ncbi:uncharacterized protein LOC133178739 [Saccostrea echinata]|uniref:uncharacterized protein LOC133178739 n=1 Tax=Saccostrea echinata TaxID=191078 RepID=UPI002A80A388|nr:uncharacterized protein LOC133178739 [Saccostrea echinata]
MTAKVADTKTHTEVNIYDTGKFPLFRVNEAVILSDFVKKADGSLVVTQVSNVFTTNKEMVTVPQEVLDMAQKKPDCLSVINAATSPLKSTVSVKGKVILACSPTTKRLRNTGEEVPFKRLKVKDGSGIINVALWRDFADTPIQQGSFVALHNFTTTQTYDAKTKAQKPVLSNRSSQSAVEFIPSFAEISDDEEDSEEESTVMPTGTIIGIESLFTYRCCLIQKCCKKKVGEDFRCPNCSIQYTINSAGYGGILKLLINYENKMSVFTVFTEGLLQLLESMNLKTDLNNKDDTLNNLKAEMPIRVKFSFQSNKITTIRKF